MPRKVIEIPACIDAHAHFRGSVKGHYQGLPEVKWRERYAKETAADYDRRLYEGREQKLAADALMVRVIGETARYCTHAVAMGNTIVHSVSSPEDFLEMSKKLVWAQQLNDRKLEPLVAVKITKWMTPEMIRALVLAGVRFFKVYFDGTTTNSEDGLTDPQQLWPIAEVLQKHDGVAMLIHGQLPYGNVDLWEENFHPHLVALHRDFPRLKIVMEHVSRATTIAVVNSLGDTVAMTFTPQHCYFSRNDLYAGKLKVHNFCIPTYGTIEDCEAIATEVTSGNPKCIMGTDTAPHEVYAKECSDCCAGVFSGPNALPLFAKLFEERDALQHLDAFTSKNFERFHDFKRDNPGTIRLWKAPNKVPMRIAGIRPIMAGQTLDWEMSA